MKFSTSFLKKGLAALSVVGLLSSFAFVATASAACINYDPDGTPTSKTPVFNQFCNVPGTVGNENDFVRVRPATSASPRSGDNGAYKDTLNSACAVGSKYDVRTYIHNGADPAYNTKNGGSAIARNVVVRQTVSLNTPQSSFTFASRITADNAASVSDTAKLSCGKNVVLKLVPSSVNVYSEAYGWKDASNSAVNGSLKIGSQGAGSGNVLACWDDRVIVVYQVVVEEAPKPPQSLVCNAIGNLVKTGKTVRVENVTYTALNGASFSNFSINWGDGNTSNGVTLPQSHTYANDGTFTITVNVNGTVNGNAVSVTSAACKASIETKKVPVCNPATGTIISVEENEAGNYKPVGDAACKHVPTTLVSTGAGDVLGLFAAITAGGAIAHRIVSTRRLS